MYEAVATSDLYCWALFAGAPGSLNDLNVLQRSPVLRRLLDGGWYRIGFTANNHDHTHSYLLVDGIYPSYDVFVSTISHPVDEAQRFFAKRQESVRKDVERLFGVLKGRFHILVNPARSMSWDFITKVITCCVILNNMIVRDEKVTEEEIQDLIESGKLASSFVGSIDPNGAGANEVDPIKKTILQLDAMKNKDKHAALVQDLVKEMWHRKGAGN